MEESTTTMMIRSVPIELRMKLKVIAVMQRRRLRDVAIEALREKAEQHSQGCSGALSVPEHAQSYH